jgi:RimJ/RimL family protein N-acetyltransferase
MELAPQVGFEPTTLRLTAGCSTIELLRNRSAEPCFVFSDGVAPSSGTQSVTDSASSRQPDHRRRCGDVSDIMKAPERLETNRLVLRRPRLSDAESIFARYASDVETLRYVSWPRHERVETTRAFLEFSDAEWERWPAGPYLVESRETGQLLGGSGFAFETPSRAATGYVFARDAWGKGYATETLRAIVETARTVAIERLSALCHVDNSASWRVLEKCGFVREGVLRGHTDFPNLAADRPCDVACYAILLR